MRWEVESAKDVASQRRDFAQPTWRGEKDLHGKTVLLLAEQGLGDTIQFMRYAPFVAAGVSAVLADGEALPSFDLQCPLLSLPLGFATDLATVPANIPYLQPHPARLEKWRERLPDNGRLRVGICWAGNSAHLNDRNRSIPLECFATLLSVPGIDFVSVQKEVNEVQATVLRVLQLGRDFEDFSDTTAVVAMLDVLVSVDTPASAARYSTRLIASGLLCFRLGPTVRPEAP
jgi:hypothetical protein